MSDTAQTSAPADGTDEGAIACRKCGEPFVPLDGRFKNCSVCRGVVRTMEKEPMPEKPEELTPGDDPAPEEKPTPDPQADVEEATPPAGPEVTGATIQPLALDIEASRIAPRPRDRFWCGALDDCPQAVHAGGFDFPKWAGAVVKEGERERAVDQYARGKLHSMTEDEAKRVQEHVARKVVRNGSIISMTPGGGRTYVAQEGDIPLGCFVYMARVVGDQKPDRSPDATLPPPLVARYAQE